MIAAGLTFAAPAPADTTDPDFLGALDRAGIGYADNNPDLTAQFDAKGRVTKVTMTYPRDFVGQQLRYAAMYQKP